MLLVSLAAYLAGPVDETMPIASFHELSAEEALPEAWTSMAMPGESRKTQYDAARAGNRGAVRAYSRNAASGLAYRLDQPVDSFGWISWTWRVDRLGEGTDPMTKAGDDHAARLYVTFEYDASNLGFVDRVKYEALRALGYGDVPLRALCYTWSGKSAPDAIYPNPYTDWVRMVTVQRGSEQLREWVDERRDVRADYRRAFGTDAPPITGVAIMTDTDNSGATAVAYYGDITLHAPPREAEPVSRGPSQR